jgi:hypothetical protein
MVGRDPVPVCTCLFRFIAGLIIATENLIAKMDAVHIS